MASGTLPLRLCVGRCRGERKLKGARRHGPSTTGDLPKDYDDVRAQAEKGLTIWSDSITNHYMKSIKVPGKIKSKFPCPRELPPPQLDKRKGMRDPWLSCTQNHCALIALKLSSTLSSTPPTTGPN